MPRIARAIAPGYPHHITQRGNRCMQTFFHDSDYEKYIALMGHWCRERDVEIWAYCLMPNHVHLIAVPETEDGLRRAIGEAHRRYSSYINKREDWRGHLWQGRFASFIMDNDHLYAAARYIETNPTRAGLVQRAADWPWSSARAHLSEEDDLLVKVQPLLKKVEVPWEAYLQETLKKETIENMKSHERTGRPLGNENFVKQLETMLERTLKPQKRGPKEKRIKENDLL